jgi:O-succinylbenzoic acid--CoA ligase
MPFDALFSGDFKQIKSVENTFEKWIKGKRVFEIKTSGSTGKPKVIKWSEDLILWQCENFKTIVNSEKNKPLFCPLPIDKTGGFIQLIRSLYLEIPIYFATPKIQISVPSDILFSSGSLTPAQIEYIIDTSPGVLKQFETILIGGAPISKKLNQKISQIKNTLIYETFGMTETASNIAFRCISKNETDFKLHSGVHINYESNGAIISIPEINLEVKTNDYLVETNNGFIIKGRLDNFINSDGLKIDVMELEDQILPIFEKIFLSKNFYIVGLSHPKFGQVPVILTNIQTIKSEMVMAFFKEINQNIENKTLPHILFRVSEFHYTTTQKLKRLPIDFYNENQVLGQWKNPIK